MKKNTNHQRRVILIIAYAMIAAGLLASSLLIPGIQRRLLWRWEIAQTYLNGMIHPVEAIPTALPGSAKPAALPPQPTPAATLTSLPTLPTAVESPTPTEVIDTPLPTATATAIPEQISLTAPQNEVQDINNCGPATLAMYLRMFGWEGDQFTISDQIKPIPQDRNVNVEELDYFIKNYAGWLNTIYRVGGSVDLLKQLLAGGVPVMIEETFHFDKNYWPNDDLWAGHYLLLTGYDDQRQAFISQDSFEGANRWVDYQVLDKQWQAFNRVYILVYPPDQEALIQSLLGENWDADANRQQALETAKAETESDPQNVFAWFNYGSNLVYFEEYELAAQAFDSARAIGWPRTHAALPVQSLYRLLSCFAYRRSNGTCKLRS